MRPKMSLRGYSMHEVYLNSTSETPLVAVPFIAFLALAIFRLDTHFTRSKRSVDPANRHRPGCGMDQNGDPLLVDSGWQAVKTLCEGEIGDSQVRIPMAREPSIRTCLPRRSYQPHKRSGTSG